VFSSDRGKISSRAIMQLEVMGLVLKNTVTSLGIEPMTFQHTLKHSVTKLKIENQFQEEKRSYLV
jgi:hypothetical protein